MVWLIIESPRLAFKKIILAEHKNYVLFLGLFLGIAGVFALFWAKKSGNSFDNLFPLLLFAVFYGMIVALPMYYVLASITFLTAKMMGGKGNFKDTYGVVGWSLVPIMISVVFILPLELATLGLFLFSSNPSAYEVKPVVTAVLLGFDGALLLWSLVLCAVGLSMAHRIKISVAFALSIGAVSMIAYISYLLFTTFNF